MDKERPLLSVSNARTTTAKSPGSRTNAVPPIPAAVLVVPEPDERPKSEDSEIAVDCCWVRYPIAVPSGTSTSSRTLSYSYGDSDSATDALSLVTSATDSDLGLLASFQYTGTGRRVAFHRGGTATAPIVRSSVFDNPIADWDQGGGTPDPTAYFGLTPHGQTRALAYWREVEVGSSTETKVLAAHRYSHDVAGRRTAVWNQQIPIAAPNAPPNDPPLGTNERSQHFAYDALGRLIGADMGKLLGPLDNPMDLTTEIDDSDLLPVKREVDWTLDSRDVWVSRILSHDADSDTVADVETASHFVGDRNELLGYDDPAAHSEPIPALADRFHNDASGNLILDDGRFYEYDAWGRLAQVSERGTLELTVSGENEPPGLEGDPGAWLVHYTYDGLGRLIKKQTPIRDGSTGDELAVRTERYFYDGARRIQEVVTDPVIAIEPEAPLGGGGEGGGSGGSGGIEIGEELALLQGGSTSDIYVDREYIYVPSGASGYVDEFIGQIDRYQDLWYILQDVNYNVIALTDSGGEVVRQHTFDPYGEILTVEDFDAHPGIKIGHQGLFFDRLEPSAPILGAVSMGAAPQLQPGVFGLYQARNRVLLPRYGRWAQKDPNASGMLHTSLWHDGESPIPELAARSLQGVTTDGLNLFAYVRTSPFNATDPTGRFFSLGDFGAASEVRGDLQQDQLSNQLDAFDAVGNLFGFDDGGLIDLAQGFLNVVGLKQKDEFGNEITQFSQKLSGAQRNTLRKQARDRMIPQVQHRLPKGSNLRNYEVHHEIPMEWGHLFPFHPNTTSNLVVLEQGVHRQINGLWNSFRAKHHRAQTTPSPLEVMDYAEHLHIKFGRHYIKP